MISRLPAYHSIQDYKLRFFDILFSISKFIQISWFSSNIQNAFDLNCNKFFLEIHKAIFWKIPSNHPTGHLNVTSNISNKFWAPWTAYSKSLILSDMPNEINQTKYFLNCKRKEGSISNFHDTTNKFVKNWRKNKSLIWTLWK